MLGVRLFSAAEHSFAAMETMVVDEQDPAATGREIGGRLRPAVARVAGVSLVALPSETPTEVSEIVVQPPPVTPAPPSPGTRGTGGSGRSRPHHHDGIVLPLTVFRKDVVDVRIRY